MLKVNKLIALYVIAVNVDWVEAGAHFRRWLNFNADNNPGRNYLLRHVVNKLDIEEKLITRVTW